MLMNDVRRLTVTDWRDMGRLRMERQTHAGVSVTTLTNSPLMTIDTRYQHEPHLAVGYFEDKKLQSFICAHCIPDKECWVLDLMIASGDPRSLHVCLDYCLEHYEAQAINMFYYAFPAKWERAYRSFWRNSVPRLKRYVQTGGTLLHPYIIPKDEFVWESILHQVVVPVPLLLKTSYLPVFN